jgi:hypothetical protein
MAQRVNRQSETQQSCAVRAIAPALNSRCWREKAGRKTVEPVAAEAEPETILSGELFSTGGAAGFMGTLPLPHWQLSPH